MFIVDEDMSVSLNRGDAGIIKLPSTKSGKKGYEISTGDILRLRVFPKKNCEEVSLVKDYVVGSVSTYIELELSGSDTKIGDIINKPTIYWYEIELNPDTYPQTIVGYDEDGPRIFLLYPEGNDSGELPSINTGKEVKVSDEAVKSIINNAIFLEALENFEGGSGSGNINTEIKLRDAITGNIYALLVENSKLVLKNSGADTPDTPDDPDVPDTPDDPDVITEPFNTQIGIWGVAQARNNTSVGSYKYYSAIDKPFRITDYPAVFSVDSDYTVNGAIYKEDGTFIEFISNLTNNLEVSNTNAKWIGINIRIPDDETVLTEPFGLDDCEFIYSNAKPLTIYSDFSSVVHNAVWKMGYFNINLSGIPVTSSAKCIYCEDYIDISSQDSISLTCPDGYYLRLFLYDENKTIKGNSFLLDSDLVKSDMKSITIVPSPDSKYMRMHLETKTASSMSTDEKLNVEVKSFTY